MPDSLERWQQRPALYVHLEIEGRRESTPADFGARWRTGETLCGQRIATAALTGKLDHVTCPGCLEAAQ